MNKRHKTISLNLPNSIINDKYKYSLIVNSDFDSGNLQQAIIGSIPSYQLAFTKNNKYPYQLIVTPSEQPFNPNYSHKISNKNFFNFSIKLKVDQNNINNINNVDIADNKKMKIKILIKRMKIMQYFNSNNTDINLFDQLYNICVYKKNINQNNKKRYNQQLYVKQKPQDIKINTINLDNDQTQIQMSFNYQLDQNYQTFFAYHYPYPYQRNLSFLSYLNHHIKQINKIKYQKNNQPQIQQIQQQQYIYYRNQILVQSLQKRQVNLLTITSIPFKQLIQIPLQQQQQSLKLSLDNTIQIYHQKYYLPYQLQSTSVLSSNTQNKIIFPFNFISRPYIFNTKPYIFLTARVHPGQTSASFAIQSIIQQLLQINCPINQSHKTQISKNLLKMFVFVIVPMINPDGVYHGCYRMDTQGQNLNRFYQNSNPHQQPSIYAIQSMITYYSERLLTYIDFHSHPHSNKGAFFYGNSFSNFHQQIQSQFFVKSLSKNSQLFSYSNSSFSAHQMASKDLNQLMSKQGCGRVFAFKAFNKNQKMNVPFCYALQLGYHGMFISDNNTNNSNNIKKQDLSKLKKIIFTPQTYKTIAYKTLQTIHETFLINCLLTTVFLINQDNKNKPNNTNIQSFNDIFILLANQSNFSSIPLLKEQLAKQIFQKEERFRFTDPQISKKVKNINSIINKNIYSRIFTLFPFFNFQLKKILLKKCYTHYFNNSNNSSLKQKAITFLKQIFYHQKQNNKKNNILNINNITISTSKQKQQFFNNKCYNISNLHKRNIKKYQNINQQFYQLTPKQFTQLKIRFPKINQHFQSQQQQEQQQLLEQLSEREVKLISQKSKIEIISKQNNIQYYTNPQNLNFNLNTHKVKEKNYISRRKQKQYLKKNLKITNQYNQNIFNDDSFRYQQERQIKIRQKQYIDKQVLINQQYNKLLKLSYKFYPLSNKRKNPNSYRNQFNLFKRQQKQIKSAIRQTLQNDQKNSIDQNKSISIQFKDKHDKKSSLNYIQHNIKALISNQKTKAKSNIKYYNQSIQQIYQKDIKKISQPFIQKSSSSKNNTLKSQKKRQTQQSQHKKNTQQSQISQITEKQNENKNLQISDIFNKANFNVFKLLKNNQDRYSQKKQLMYEVQKNKLQIDDNSQNFKKNENHLNYHMKQQKHKYYIKSMVSSPRYQYQFHSVSPQKISKINYKNKRNNHNHYQSNIDLQNKSEIYKTSQQLTNLCSIINGINNTQQDLLLPKIVPKKQTFDMILNSYQIENKKKKIKNSQDKQILNFVKKKSTNKIINKCLQQENLFKK